jgi:hypothetical protein
MSTNAELNQIPREESKREVVCTYDFDIHGGAVDTAGIELSEMYFGLNPGEALRVAKIYVVEDFTSDGSATVSLGTEDTDPDDILDDTAIASLTAGDLLDGVQVPQDASTWIVNSGTTFLPIKAQVKVAALTAGKLDVHAEIVRLY